MRGGPAVGEEAGDIAGATAEVGDAGPRGGRVGDMGEQVDEGAGAVARVPQVLPGSQVGLVADMGTASSSSI